VEHHALVIWHGDIALLDPPAIICRSWHPSEDPDLGDVPELALRAPTSTTRARSKQVQRLVEIRHPR
jgi:hypothetical protein